MLKPAVGHPMLSMFWIMMIILRMVWFMLPSRIMGDTFRNDDLDG
ncbi:hypothetical protein ABZ871_11230 [Streptomyces populi]